MFTFTFSLSILRAKKLEIRAYKPIKKYPKISTHTNSTQDRKLHRNPSEKPSKNEQNEDARQVFVEMPGHSPRTLISMISSYIKIGQPKQGLEIFNKVIKDGKIRFFDSFVYTSVLGVCCSPNDGKKIHNLLIKTGLPKDLYASNALLKLFTKCGVLEDACRLFDEMPNPTVVSWSTIISGCVQNGQARRGVEYFNKMMGEGYHGFCDHVVYTSVVVACSRLMDVVDGRKIHALLIKCGFHSDVFANTALLDLYAKCGEADEAQRLFEGMECRNEVTWNGLLGNYARKGDSWMVFRLFLQMQKEGIGVTPLTFNSLLNCCCGREDHERGKQIHNQIVRRGLDVGNLILGNVVVDMYAKCGNVEYAERAFERMRRAGNVDVITWNSLIAGKLNAGLEEDAFDLFSRMRQDGLICSERTLTYLMSSSASSAALDLGKQLQALGIHLGHGIEVFIGTSLIHMYSKCGEIDDAKKAFDDLVNRNSVSWAAMIVGYAHNGYGAEAIELFEKMLLQEGVVPESAAFVGVLTACSHSGLVNDAVRYFESISRVHKMVPSTDHYACMVDLYARSGLFAEAEKFMENMPIKPVAHMWGSLLSASRIYKNMEVARRAAEKFAELEPENSVPYVILSNLYASCGMWNDVAEIRGHMTGKLVKKKPGWSWIQIKNKVYTFASEEGSHPEIGKINAKLETLVEQFQQSGYVPDTSLVLLDVDDNEKIHLILHHSEKLALAYGLMKLPAGLPIRIVKNVRVCGDCHTFMKFASKVTERVITLRDSTRFHHFKAGVCSCSDYW